MKSMKSKMHMLLCALAVLGVALQGCRKEHEEYSPGSSDSGNVEVPESLLESISIVQFPKKTIYGLGESIDLDGLKVIGNYDDGQQRSVNVSLEQITGFSSETPMEKQEITVTIEGKKATFSVRIAPVHVKNGVLTDIVDGHDEIILPEHVKSIMQNVFNGKKVTKVVLNEGLVSIGERAFMSSSIQEIVFPSTLEDFGKYIFCYCNDLQQIDLSNTRITTLPAGAFMLSGIKEIALPEMLKKIGAQAFLGTSKLGMIKIPENVEVIEREAFRESGITRAQLPNSIRTLTERAFYYCQELTEVTAYGSYTDSGSDAVVQASCFVGCPQLLRFEIPQSIRILGQGLLGGNKAVTQLTIPANVTQMAFSTFNHTGIRKVKVEAVNPPLAANVWNGFPKEIIDILVPTESVDKYKTANGWKDYADKIKAIQ